MISKIKRAVAFFVISAMVASCTPINKNNTYNATEVGQSAKDKEAETNIKNTGDAILLGGALGAVAGSVFGNGRGKTTAMAVGALIGAVAFAIAENRLTQ